MSLKSRSPQDGVVVPVKSFVVTKSHLPLPTEKKQKGGD